MKRFFTPSTLVPVAIIAAVAATVAIANWRDMQRGGAGRTPAVLSGSRGARTSREDLNRRIGELRKRLVAQPEDVGAAVTLADALLRQSRVAGNAGLAIEGEQALKRALHGDRSNYDANRTLSALYLSQHRFRDAIAIGEKNRDQRPYDPVNYGVIGDGHLELGEYDQAFDAFDHMMRLRPSASAYARVAYARELQGDLTGAVESMKLATDATAADDPEALAWYHSQGNRI